MPNKLFLFTYWSQSTLDLWGAIGESFFHTLKAQWIGSRGLATQREAELSLFQYIEVYYNRRRKHSANGWLSPVAFELRQAQKMWLNRISTFLWHDQSPALEFVANL